MEKRSKSGQDEAAACIPLFPGVLIPHTTLQSSVYPRHTHAHAHGRHFPGSLGRQACS